MPLKIAALTFFALLALLFSYSVQAATTYDFLTRSAGVDAFAYDGISSSALPLNNTFPSNQHSNSEYTNISINNGSVKSISTSQNNNYPMLRYVFELDEAETNIAQLDFFWNGKGTNANNGRNDGVILYIWNYSTGSYEQISTSGDTSSEVNLTHTITINIVDYINENNNNRLTLLVVSNDKTNGKKANTIEADYVSIEVQTVSPTKLSVSNNNVPNDYDVSSYGGPNQDKTGTVEIRDAGLSLFLEGNRWQKIVFPYTVTVDTVIEFDFQSTVQGEIHGLGFDDDLTISQNRSFKVYGTQNWGIADFATYTGNGITHFTIPVGQFYTGTFQYLFFMNDDDSNQTGNSLYSNINVYENVIPIQPIAEYRFDELNWDGVTNDVLDSSGNALHGLSNNTLPVVGLVCNAADFDRSNSIQVANNTLLEVGKNNGNYSVNFWLNPRSTTGGWSNILHKGNINYERTFAAWFQPGNSKVHHRISTTANSNEGNDSTTALGLNSWTMVTLVKQGNQLMTYFNGTLDRQSTLSGPSVSNSGPLYIGDDPWYTGIDALMDELIIFDGALGATEIQTIRTNNLAGNGWDGTSRACPTTVTPLVEYRFEETSWNGVAGEILDNTGNGHHAQALRDSILVNPAPVSAPSAIPGDPGTCGYTSQSSGAIQTTGLPLDTTTAGIKTTVTFWMNWNGIENVMPVGWYIHDIWMVGGSMGFNTGGGDLYGISSAGLANGWHHVAVEFTNGSVTNNRMHIDGVEQVLTQRRRSPNNGRAFVDSEFRIGGWRINASYDFQGFMDEVRIYEGALSTTEINTIKNEVHPCNTSPIIHHYEIVHDGQGLTCDTESVVIKACTNASCSNLSSQSVTLDFLADGALISSPTFTGSTIVNFNHTVVETLTFSVANATLAASNAIVCDDGSSASCDMAFTDAGFRFLSSTGISYSTTIPNQTSGTVFGEELKLQAVNNVNGVCTSLFTGNTNVDLSQENVAPSGTGGLSFSIAGNNIAKHSGVTNTTLNFGANSIATIPTPIYHDAGQIRLHAHYNVGGITLFGSSNPFWVSPAELVVSAKSGTTDLIGATATATPTHKAGENFILSVTAYNAASPSVITPNYSPGQIQFMLKRTGPTLGNSVDGDLIYGGGATSKLGTSTSPIFQNVTLTNFSSGFSTYGAAQYSEVGLLNLDVQDSNYGNVNIIIPATAINIGRFIPDYFEQTVAEQGSFDAVCNQNTPFAYTGQTLVSDSSKGAISYLVNPIVELTAKNIHGDTTKNYTETGYMKLISAANFIVKPTTDSTINGKNTPLALLPLQANLFAGTVSHDGLVASDPSFGLPLAAGVLHYELADADDFLYPRNKNAEVNAQDNDIDFIIDQVNFVDSDGIGIKNTVDITATASVNIRFGRAYLENSFGPETSNLTQILSTQYLDTNGRYTINMQDDCTDFDKTKMTIDSGTLNKSFTGVDSDVVTGLGLLDNGETRAMYLTAPGAGNQGNIGVSYDIYDWLKYDWNNNTVDDNPSAVATFGLFRGNDRIIYSREVFD